MEKNLPTWSKSSLEKILECPRQYFLSKRYPDRTNGKFAAGIFMHRKVEQLFTSNRNFKSAQSWANSCAGQWKHLHIRNVDDSVIRGSNIIWKDKNEPWIYDHYIKQWCKKNFDRLLEEGPPFIFLNKDGDEITEYKFEFEFDGRGFSGRMDEIRRKDGQIIIRDYKTGKVEKNDFLERNIQTRTQPTFYCFALCFLCSQDENFREKIGITKEEASNWGGDPIFIDEDLRFQFYKLDADQDPTLETIRTDVNYKNLCSLMDMATIIKQSCEEYYSEQGIYPAREDFQCKYCLYRKELMR